MRKKILVIGLVCILCPQLWAQADMKTYVDNLMAKMTLEEKLGQLNLMPGNDLTTGAVIQSPLAALAAKGQLGAVLNVKGVDKIRDLQRIAVKKSRLGIPLLFGQDVIHGYQTVLPIPLALSCTWDIDGIEAGARMSAKEATALGINWAYSPMVDISIEPRWGRVAEGNGEDPFLGSKIAEAMVKGLQGNYGKENVMACVKHFALYGAVESGRDYNTVDMSRVRMFNQYFPPYEAAAKAGAGSFMSSFNLVDGIPATANYWLLTDILRKKWNYDGFVVTDYGSITEMSIHGIGDAATCSALALNAGTDMDMCAEHFIKNLRTCLENNTVTMETINQACRRILEAKYKLGLFHEPYRFIDSKREKSDVYNEENRALARNMAAESFVLLKNQNHLLPLKKNAKVALVGPLADNRSNMVGCWSTGDVPEQYKTLKEVMQQVIAANGGELFYAQGSNIYDDSLTQAGATFGRPISRVDEDKAYEEALDAAAKSDVIVAAMGEMAEMSGESSSRSDLNLPACQMRLLQALVKTGKPVVMLNFSGRPTILKWESENVPAIMNVWFGGSETADAICDVVFGDKNPSGKLTMTFPQNMGQIPIYYNHLNTGRPVADDAPQYIKYNSNYLDVRNAPLYYFGYGLSYTSFHYSNMILNGRTASVTVTNTGIRDGDEIVQLYIHDKFASIARPVKELKGFKRIHLRAGESREVSFEITDDLLKFYDFDGNELLEPGEFTIMIGPDSNDNNLKTGVFTLH